MNRALQISAITLTCVAGYIGLRSLPVEQCELLHYGDYVNAEGVIEGCGYEEVAFFDLEELRYPVNAKIEALGVPRAGEEAQFVVTLSTSTGRPIRAEDLAIAHTERLHAMVIDPQRRDYHHVHPEPTGMPGSYQFALTPAAAGTYRVFFDFISLISNRRMLVAGEFEVSGKDGKDGGAMAAAAAPVPAATRLQAEVDGLRYTLHPLEGALGIGRQTRFELRIEALDGGPLVFEPVMDSYAHVVAFDSARRGFAHFHPLNPLVEGQDPARPDLNFAFRLDEPGHYRVWAQLKVNGRERFVPFDLVL